MTNTVFPWQTAAWTQLQQLKGRMPHAILFHGPQGIGKTEFAERFAQSLLCESPLADGSGCNQCASCGWFVQYSHPDYRRVRPEVLDESGDEGEDGEPLEAKKTSKTAKPSKEIKIDQVRALADFMNVSTHRNGKRVVTLYPVEALNTQAANSLLKTLEEPPADTVILLVSNSLDRLLPTILSRCRKFAMAMPSQQESLDWLKSQGIKDADVWLAEQGGAPLAAHALAQTDAREVMDEFLRGLAAPGVDNALRVADSLQKSPVPDLVAWQQRWLFDLFFSQTFRENPVLSKIPERARSLAQRAEINQLLRALKETNERRAIADHPLSAKLFIEAMLLDYSTIFS